MKANKNTAEKMRSSSVMDSSWRKKGSLGRVVREVLLKKWLLPIKYSLCCSYTLGSVIFHWSLATRLKKTGSPSPSNHQLPKVPQLGVGLHAHLPSPCCSFVWLELTGLAHAAMTAMNSCVTACYVQKTLFP